MKLFIIITILATAHLGNQVAGDSSSGDSSSKNGVICEPGKKFLDDRGCNTCICSRDGMSAGCTKIGCPEPKPVPLDMRPCTPNTTFRVGCRRCRCSKDGFVTGCSKGH